MPQPSLSSENLASFPRPSKVLALVISCFDHKTTWPRVGQWAAAADRDERNVAIVAANSSLDVPFRLAAAFPSTAGLNASSSHLQLLTVRGSDGYCGLPVKVVMALHAVLSLPAFKNIGHIIKIDDTDVTAGLRDGFHLEQLRRHLDSSARWRSADYLGRRGFISKLGRGQSIEYVRQQYPHRIANDSHWSTGAPSCDEGTNFTYVQGGKGMYILSRHAMQLIASVWPLDSMGNLSIAECAEDVTIAKALSHRCVEPQEFDFPFPMKTEKTDAEDGFDATCDMIQKALVDNGMVPSWFTFDQTLRVLKAEGLFNETDISDGTVITHILDKLSREGVIPGVLSTSQAMPAPSPPPPMLPAPCGRCLRDTPGWCCPN